MTIAESCTWAMALLRLEREPVGVTFLPDEESYRAHPAEERQGRMSYCTAVRRAGQGRGQKMRGGHQACGGGAAALGFVKQNEESLSGQRRLKMGCYHSLGVSRSISREMVYCGHTPYGVAVTPLQSCRTDPDVVIVVCAPYDAMRILHGYSYHHGFADGMQTAGLQAICHDCTSLPYEKRRINLSMLCSGTRMLAGWKREEMAVGMPFSMWTSVVDGIRSTVNPYERDKDKTRIAGNLQQAGLGDALEIHFGSNYDDGCYKGGLAD